jgi:hypothetical protein
MVLHLETDSNRFVCILLALASTWLSLVVFSAVYFVSPPKVSDLAF